MKQKRILIGLTVVTTLISSGDFAWSTDSGTSLSLQLPDQLIYGAISESAPAPTDADTQAYRLAKQVVNPVSWLLSVPFQANEDFGYARHTTVISSRLTFSRSFPSLSAEIGT